MARPKVVRESELRAGQPTEGMTRREAFSIDDVWVGTATTDPGGISGWHHHGAHETYVYCVRGRLRIESGDGGGDVDEAGAGDFMHIPSNTVHRESNPGEEEQHVVVVRVGSGEVVVNVEGPAP